MNQDIFSDPDHITSRMGEIPLVGEDCSFLDEFMGLNTTERNVCTEDRSLQSSKTEAVRDNGGYNENTLKI